MADFDSLKQEISFVKFLMTMNVTMLNKSVFLQQFLLQHLDNDIYILLYNFEYLSDMDKVMKTFTRILKKRKNYGPNTAFAAMYFKVLNKINDQVWNLTDGKPRVSLFRNAEKLVENYEIGFNPGNDPTSELLSLYEKLYEMQQSIKTYQVKLIEDLSFVQKEAQEHLKQLTTLIRKSKLSLAELMHCIALNLINENFLSRNIQGSTFSNFLKNGFIGSKFFDLMSEQSY